MDFVNETSTFENDETAILPYTAAIALSATITANSTLPVVPVLGVEFYHEVNGQMYALKNGAKMPCQLLLLILHNYGVSTSKRLF